MVINTFRITFGEASILCENRHEMRNVISSKKMNLLMSFSSVCDTVFITISRQISDG